MIDANVRSLWALAPALVFLIAARAGAQEEASADPLAVAVDGPCIDAEALRFAVSVRTARHPDARVAIAVRCGEPVHADIAVTRGAAVHERAIDVSAAEVASLIDTIALIVTVALEDEPSAAEPDPGPARVDAPPIDPPVGEPSAPPSASSPDRFGAAVGVVVLGGLLPDAALGLSVGGEWRAGSGLGVELEATAFAPSGIELFEGRIDFWSITGRAALCAIFSVHEHLALGGCAGALVGGVSAAASGFRTENLSRWDPWLAIDARARVELSFDPFVVRVDGVVAAALVAPAFYIERLDGERAAAHAISPVLGGATIAFGVRFGP